MGYNYKQSIEMFGQEKADQLFESNNISKGKVKKSEREETPEEYIKMSEYEHGKKLHKYLKKHDIRHTHIGNESGQMGTKNIVIMMSKKKAQGVSKGYPDYHILLDKGDYNRSIHIELKKAKGVKGGLNGSTISPEQVEWIAELNKVPEGYATISHGYKEAIKYIEEINSLPTHN